MIYDAPPVRSDLSLIPQDTRNLEQDAKCEGIAGGTTLLDHTPSHPSLPIKGDTVELFLELDKNFYPETISSISPAGKFVIKYYEGEMETVNLSTGSR